MRKQVNFSPIQVEIKDFNYRFDINGNIEPFIEITPSIKVDDETHLSKFILLNVHPAATVAKGDRILYIPPRDKTGTCDIKVIERSDEPRLPVNPVVCPVCGAPLYPGTIGDGRYIRCINRACKAQIVTNVHILLAALGVVPQSSMLRVLAVLASRGLLDTPGSIFRMTLADISSPYTTELECQMFLQYLHSVRGHVSISQMLRGLRIPGIDASNAAQIDAICQAHGIGFSNIYDLCHPELLEKIYPEINWRGWLEFLSLPINKDVLIDLSCFLWG